MTIDDVPAGCTLRPVPDDLHDWLMDGEGGGFWGVYRELNAEPYTPKTGDRVESVAEADAREAHNNDD